MRKSMNWLKKASQMENKQPWEMTRNEFGKSYPEKSDNWSSVVHRNLSQGKQIPDIVRKELGEYDFAREQNKPKEPAIIKSQIGDPIVRYTHSDGTGLLNNSGLDRTKLTDEEVHELVSLMDFGLNQPPSGVKGVFYFTMNGEQKHSRMLELLAKASIAGVVRTKSKIQSYPVWESDDGQICI